jgi:hypothetical protein
MDGDEIDSRDGNRGVEGMGGWKAKSCEEGMRCLWATNTELIVHV